MGRSRDDADRAEARAAAVRRLAGPSTGGPALDRLVELAARLLDAPSAQVALVDDVAQVMAGVGVAAEAVGTHGPASDSLCTVTVEEGAPLVITDARADARVSELPPVASGMAGTYLGVPLRAADGLVIGALCVFDDAPREWTERDVATLERLAEPVVAELELAALNDDYETGRLVLELAVDAAQIGTFDWDLTTGELRWDDRVLELFGRDRESFDGTIEDFNAAVHPEDLPRVTELLTAAVESRGDYAAEYRVLLPGGQVRWISARGRALAGESGAAVRLLGAAFDTTAVQEGEARVARVLEAMPTAFFHLDAEWRFGYVNAEGERLLQRSRGELVGGVLWELFPEAVGSDFERYYRQAVATGEPVAFDAYYPEPLHAWYEVRAWPTPDGLSVYFVDVTQRHLAQQQVERNARRSDLLATVTAELSGTLEVETALRRLAPLIVPELADWCVTTLVEDDGHRDWRHSLRDVGWWHRDEELLGTLQRYVEIRLDALSSPAFVPRALASAEPIVVNQGAAAAVCSVLGWGEAQFLTRRLAPESAAVVRLLGRDRTVGLLSLFRGASREAFTHDDVVTLKELAARAGLALDNARLFAEQQELAEGLQRSLLTAPPEPEHVEVAVRYEPAAEAAQVGGDWYDAFIQRHGETMVVVGDVVGHDTAAAAAMGQVRSLLRGIAVHSGEGPAEVLRGVDLAMQTLRLATTATAVVARLEQTAADRLEGVTRLRWSSAGHPPPMVVTPAGEVSMVGLGESDLLLGFDPDARRREGVVRLAHGSTVLLYTDGLFERRGEAIDDSLLRLRAAMTALAAERPTLDELCDRLIERMLPERPEDDVALVAVRLRPEDAPRP